MILWIRNPLKSGCGLLFDNIFELGSSAGFSISSGTMGADYWYEEEGVKRFNSQMYNSTLKN